MEKILVVEDDADIQEVLKNYLMAEGYEVRLAEDGVCHLNLPAADLELLPEGESAQLRMFRGIVRSLCSLDEVTSVQVLVDGEMRTSFGAVDISQPLRP